MPEPLSDEQILKEIRQLLAVFEKELVQHLGPLELSSTRTRLLRLFDVWKQSYLRRIIDLADAAHEMFRQGRLVPGCTLTRSVFETVGILYYVHKKIVEFTEKSDPKSIHFLLISAVFGSKDMAPTGKPIQVLTAIDHLDNEFEWSREEYNHLCEYAHPNLKGGFGTYVSQKGQSLESEFGTNPQELLMGTWGLASLGLILSVGAEINNRLRSLHPKFVAMAEKHAPNDPL